MQKSQLFITLAALALCVLLAFAPKYVVDNNKQEGALDNSANTEIAEQGEAVDMGHAEISPELEERLSLIKNTFSSAEQQEAFQALNELIAAYKGINAYDSAAYYAANFAERFPSAENFLSAGDLYYEAYTFAVSEERVKLFSEKLREQYEKVEEYGGLTEDARVRLGMTYVSGENPMRGITMIREVLRDNPNNTTAIFNLGLLSMQSGQFDRAVERFKKLKELQADNLQAMFYLGISYLENGQEEEAKAELTALKELETDPQILETVNSYLSRIQ